MSIRINPKTGLITLHTAHTSYQMWADSHGVVHHLYYGPSVGESDLRGVEYYSDCGFSPQPAGMDRQRDYSLDTLCQEYTGSGVGDFRIGCLRLSGPDGSRAADFRFVSAEAVPRQVQPARPARRLRGRRRVRDPPPQTAGQRQRPGRHAAVRRL